MEVWNESKLALAPTAKLPSARNMEVSCAVELQKNVPLIRPTS